MTFLQNTGKRSARRAWPIMGYVGPNGGGKSAAMVWDTIPTLLSGRAVLSTVRVLDFENPRPCEGFQPNAEGDEVACTRCYEAVGDPEGATGAHSQAHRLWRPLTDWGQLIEARNCDVLLDEVTGVASSRESHSMPSPVANKLVQLRRADVVVRWSAPSWARADKIIRECSQAVTFCEGHMSKKIVDADGGDRMWSQRRLFKWRTFDAALFEDFTAGKREQLSSMVSDWHWGPKSPAFKAYDTYDAVSTVGTVTESGRCYQCGGSRAIPKCKGHGPGDELVTPDAAVAPARAKPEEADGTAGVPGRRRRLELASQ